jgi:orotidine-5'-phosphate decarboxylase
MEKFISVLKICLNWYYYQSKIFRQQVSPSIMYFFLMKKEKPQDYLALALDNVRDTEQLERIVHETKDYFGTYKIGLELFTKYGPTILDFVRKENRAIFLDLKFHDIPNTVAQAVYSAALLNVALCTLHTQGGTAMMRAASASALNAREDGLTAPKLIGVTVLTSIDNTSLNNDLNVRVPIGSHIRHLASLAVTSGLNGIVCSAKDLITVKDIIPDTFEIITPGIRSAGIAANDQKRIATPAEAIAHGSTLLVIGREVTLADNHHEAAQHIYDEVTAALHTI